MKTHRICIGLLVISFITHCSTIKITLKENFLKHAGRYKFSLDVEKARGKTFYVIIQAGKATVEGDKNVSINNNVISAKIKGLLKKKANDLEILAITGDFQFRSATLGIKNEFSKLVVDVGPGLMFSFISEPGRPGVGKHPVYSFKPGPNLPDGTYTLKLIIPAAEDKKYTFEVKDYKVVSVSGDETGTAKDGYLEIDAQSMCAKRQAKKVGAIIGYSLPVIVGTAAVIGYSATKTIPAVLKATGKPTITTVTQTGSSGSFAVTVSQTVVDNGRKAASIALGTSASMAAATAITPVATAGTTTAATGSLAAAFGWRQATAQLTCDSCSWIGDKAVKFDYDECRNNELMIDLSPEKINITGE